MNGLKQQNRFEIFEKVNGNWFILFSIFRCEFVEIDDQHALEIDHPHQLALANILVND